MQIKRIKTSFDIRETKGHTVALHTFWRVLCKTMFFACHYHKANRNVTSMYLFQFIHHECHASRISRTYIISNRFSQNISLSLYAVVHHEFHASRIFFVHYSLHSPMYGRTSFIGAHHYTSILIKVFPCIRVVCFLLTCTFFSAFFRSITRHDDSAKLFYFISFGTCVVFAWSIYPEIYLLSLLAQQISFSFYD